MGRDKQSGSVLGNLGSDFIFQGTLTMPENIFSCPNWGGGGGLGSGLLYSGWRPGVLLNVLPCPQSPAKHHLAQTVNSAKIKQLGYRERNNDLTRNCV